MIANASHLRSHKGRKPIAVSEAAPAAELNYFLSPCIHDVAVGDARESDDMDAATRRRFA